MRWIGVGAGGLQAPPNHEGVAALELDGAATCEEGFELRGREFRVSAGGGELIEKETST